MIAPAPRPLSRMPTAWVLPLVYATVVLLVAGIWLQRVTTAADLAPALGTIGVGIVCNVCCAILGTYLVLRRMSLLGDAISHAMLPGIVIAYLLTGQIYGLPIMLGAMLLGMLTSLLTQLLSTLGKVAEDASMGVVFTSLFAAGVIMIDTWARGADLDTDCVLFGLIDIAGADLRTIAGLTVPRALLSLLPALVLVLVYVSLFWKELKIVAFDPALAAAMGVSVVVIHYSLMAMVASVTVAAFESVGSIVVVAMLVVPAATGALLSERLLGTMLWAVLIGATSAVFGYLAAASLNTNVAGMMAVMAGVQFAGAVFLAPRNGLVSRWLRNFQLSLRIAGEDRLARLYRLEEAHPHAPATSPARRSRLVEPLALWRLRRKGWVERAGGGVKLTEAGRTTARGIVRAHRLWESFLDKNFDLPRDHLHEPAERMEHFLDPTLQADLDAELAGRRTDPHGKEIPPQQ